MEIADDVIDFFPSAALYFKETLTENHMMLQHLTNIRDDIITADDLAETSTSYSITETEASCVALSDWLVTLGFTSSHDSVGDVIDISW